MTILHGTNFPDSPEPIYGFGSAEENFKIAVTVPTDNIGGYSTNDYGVVVVSDEAGEPPRVQHYTVGGGMGRTHWVETSFPANEPLGYVPPRRILLYAVKAIVVTQRENGREDDRK